MNAISSKITPGSSGRSICSQKELSIDPDPKSNAFARSPDVTAAAVTANAIALFASSRRPTLLDAFSPTVTASSPTSSPSRASPFVARVPGRPRARSTTNRPPRAAPRRDTPRGVARVVVVPRIVTIVIVVGSVVDRARE